MFHFAGCGPPSCDGVTAITDRPVSRFGNPRIEACSAAPRGISLPATSFFASRSQGIPHVPLVAYPQISKPHEFVNRRHEVRTRRNPRALVSYLYSTFPIFKQPSFVHPAPLRGSRVKKFSAKELYFCEEPSQGYFVRFRRLLFQGRTGVSVGGPRATRLLLRYSNWISPT